MVGNTGFRLSTRMIPIALAALIATASIPAANYKATAASSFPFEEITVKQLQDGYAKGQFTAEDVVTAYLERIKTYESTYNAFTAMNPNALEEAREYDRRRAAGEKLGPLAGVPIVMKEAVDMAGYPSTFGWAQLAPDSGVIELVPEKDAPVVTRLKEAGAIILGRTNIPAFSESWTSAYNSWAGHTHNSFDPDLVPGASSAGTATAVSGNFAVLGIAEETGGSIQNPAGAQALVGVKPTFGLVPNTGVVPLAGSTRDVVGPHARTVYDAALMLDAIAGYTPADPKTVASIGNMPAKSYTEKLNKFALKGKRIGLYGPGWRDQPLTEETQALYDRAVEELEKQGAIVVSDPFAGTDFAELIKNTASNNGFQSFIYDMEEYLENLGPSAPVDSVTELFALTGKPWEENGPVSWITYYLDADEAMKDPDAVPDLEAFAELRAEFIRSINKVMDSYKLDAFVFPQMFKETPTIESGEEIGPTTVSEINVAGLPLVTVPAGYYESGAPFSLAFFGKMWSEASLLGYAYDYEQATKHRKAPQLIVEQ
ncbi:MAG TPA: amidase [Paenibacillus sp.]|nr:amidase [Paenibacillus sp.]